MRDSKFRVWCKNIKEWETHGTCLRSDGQLIHLDNGRLMPLGKDNHIIQFYTGLKDKNGKEIYEGDIVKQVIRASDDFQSYPCDPDNYEVIFQDGGFWLSRPYNETRYVRDFANLCEFVGFDKYEVIGNIYTNPELLEVSNE